MKKIANQETQYNMVQSICLGPRAKSDKESIDNMKNITSDRCEKHSSNQPNYRHHSHNNRYVIKDSQSNMAFSNSISTSLHIDGNQLLIKN